MNKRKILYLLVFVVASILPFENWTRLQYQTPSDCFDSGIKHVYLPYPGIGSLVCLKRAIELLPDTNKSFQLIVGHTVGLLGASLATTCLLLIAARFKMPHARETLGFDFAESSSSDDDF